MPYLYFSRQSDDRKESFFSEIPPRNSIQGETFSESIELPDYLLSCIYFCIFYLRYDVERGKLARLFMAQRLIPEKNGEIMEDTAEEVIDDLIDLGFLEILYHYGFPPQTLSLAGSFSFDGSEETDFLAGVANSPVRALIEDDGKNNPPNFSTLAIQSLFLITKQRRLGGSASHSGLSPSYLRCICKLKDLSVLDLDGKLESLPDDIGELIHLRYLSLNWSYLDQLPTTLINLQNLQTLEINFSGKNQYQFPPEIFQLQQLRHLLIRKCINDGEIRVPKGIGKLINLQTCDGIYAGEGTAKELGNLNQLRKLAVKRVTEDHSNELAAAIMEMESLSSLSLEAENSHNGSSSLLPEFESFSPPCLLHELRLSGGLIEIPSWVFSIRELTVLSLSNSNLMENSTSVLQFLPKLKHLALYNASISKTIGKEFCGVGGFPKLETLTVWSCTLVEWSEIVNGAFPSLKHLCFRNCMRLRFLPEGLQKIPTLEGLSLMPSYNDLGRRLKGEENYKIKHIPNVRIREMC